MRSVFLDRDGVINENSNDHVKSWEEFTFLPGSLLALRWLRMAGFRVFVVTNQAIIGRGLVSSQTIEDIHHRMRTQIELYGGSIAAVRYCPHDHHDSCACRKPQPGMLIDLMQEWQINPVRSYMVGDALTDIAAGHAIGCPAVLVQTGRGAEQAELPELEAHRPEHIAMNLLDAVRWIFCREGLTVPRIEYDMFAHKPLSLNQPAAANLGI
ncbi:MAG: D-glycero-beta-D-manno-heptose 1,7-bisphosphate 7-phosphatase [Chloroflexales bacterium]|nr:D-glycero-beta-D-manno-heptose 1,7-bisphosphate 7-phosphatase [Chloroflexales bacterium]